MIGLVMILLSAADRTRATFDCANPPANYVPGPRHFYRMTDSLNLDEGRTSCEDDGAQMAIPYVEDDYKFMKLLSGN